MPPVRCMNNPNATGDYQITYSEDFGSYPVGGAFFPNNNWERVRTDPALVTYDDPTIVAIPPGKAGSGNYLRVLVSSAPPNQHLSGIMSKVSRVPTLGNSGVGPSGWIEMDRWAIIAEFYPFRAPSDASCHFPIFLRVVPLTNDELRFGVALQRSDATRTGCPIQAFLQFEGYIPGTTTRQGFTLCFGQELNPAIDWNNTNQRYATTFEEWKQQEPLGGFKLHWLGGIYSVNTSTFPWTYTCIGSKEWYALDNNNQEVWDNYSTPTRKVKVPDLLGSQILLGDTFYQLGFDVDSFSVANWVY